MIVVVAHVIRRSLQWNESQPAADLGLGVSEKTAPTQDCAKRGNPKGYGLGAANRDDLNERPFMTGVVVLA